MDTQIVIILCVAFLAIAIIYISVLLAATKSIFHGSGHPVDMANIAFKSVMKISQIIVGMVVISVITLLMVSSKISNEVGLPIITTIVGYLLGKETTSKLFK